MTNGEMFFYFGLIAMPSIAVISIITAIIFGAKRKKLKTKLDEDYGSY